MYEPYPISGPAQEPEQIQPPRGLLNAVKLMCTGCGPGWAGGLADGGQDQGDSDPPAAPGLTRSGSRAPQLTAVMHCRIRPYSSAPASRPGSEDRSCSPARPRRALLPIAAWTLAS
jgi:hypothetical protein